MTLQEKIEEITVDDGKYIHIGAACGFFFVGTKEEYEANIDRIDEEYRLKIKKQIRKCNDALRKRAFIRLELAAITDKGIIDYTSELLKLKEKLEHDIKMEIRIVTKTYNALLHRKEELKNWIPFRDREVKETYERIAGDGVIITVCGDESGKYWDRNEVIMKHNLHSTAVTRDDE